MATATENKIYKMLIENTGRHMLDSGGDSGRHWQQNKSLSVEDFQAAPASYLDQWGSLEISLFHHLAGAVTYDAPLDAAYREFTRGSDKTYMEDIAAFLEYIGATYDESQSYNSYNYDSALSQCIQWQEFALGDRQLVLLQIHGGADIRGGYTAPAVFSLNDEYSLISEYATVYCTGEDPHAYDYSGGEWTRDGEYSLRFTPYSMQQESLKVGVSAYIPCESCGAPLEGTDTRQRVGA